MAQRGVLFAIDDQTLKNLKATKGDPRRREFIETLEESIAPELSQATDKAWYFLYVMFVTGKSSSLCKDVSEIEFKSMSRIFKGAVSLHRADFYIINLVHKNEVENYAELCAKLTPACLWGRYETLNEGWFHQGEYKNEPKQFEYIVHWYHQIALFLEMVRKKRMHLLFTSTY